LPERNSASQNKKQNTGQMPFRRGEIAARTKGKKIGWGFMMPLRKKIHKFWKKKSNLKGQKRGLGAGEREDET